MDSIHPNIYPSLFSFLAEEQKRCAELRAEKRNLLSFGKVREHKFAFDNPYMSQFQTVYRAEINPPIEMKHGESLELEWKLEPDEDTMKATVTAHKIKVDLSTIVWYNPYGACAFLGYNEEGTGILRPVDNDGMPITPDNILVPTDSFQFLPEGYIKFPRGKKP